MRKQGFPAGVRVGTDRTTTTRTTITQQQPGVRRQQLDNHNMAPYYQLRPRQYAFVILVCTVCAVILVTSATDSGQRVTKDKFTAAVLDQSGSNVVNYTEPPTREGALLLVSNILSTYSKRAQQAKSQGADIIVFPEYGLIPRGVTRDTIEPFLESVPDPQTSHSTTPCTATPQPENTEIQKALSCIARDEGMYVVANMGNVIPCAQKTDPKCPADGRYQYNTNVAFDSTGKLVARYHKYNLFWEFHYDVPPRPEAIFFDTPFGRFGTFVCFDILYHNPAIDLVEKNFIDTVAFPTAWMNVLPHLSAVPFHQAYAIGNRVNLIGANLHEPSDRFSGSGIYGFNRTITYRNNDDPKGALLIGTLFSRPRHAKVKTPMETNDFEVSKTNGAVKTYVRATRYTVDKRDSDVSKNVIVLSITDPDFTSEVFGDEFNFMHVPYEKTCGNISVCHGSFCCSLDFCKRNSDEQFAFGAFRGPYHGRGVLYRSMRSAEVCHE